MNKCACMSVFLPTCMLQCGYACVCVFRQVFVFACVCFSSRSDKDWPVSHPLHHTLSRGTGADKRRGTGYCNRNRPGHGRWRPSLMYAYGRAQIFYGRLEGERERGVGAVSGWVAHVGMSPFRFNELHIRQ